MIINKEYFCSVKYDNCKLVNLIYKLQYINILSIYT